MESISKKYKYLHLVWHNEALFAGQLTQMLSEKYGFSSSEHCFVTTHPDVYEKLEGTPNLFYFACKNPCSAEVVNRLSPYCDWMFLHNICNPLEICKIYPWNQKKILWRSWGGNRLSFHYHSGQLVKNCIKHCIQKYAISCVSNFCAVGIANVVDQIELNQWLGNCLYVKMPYVPENMITIDPAELTPASHDAYRILIGHSAYTGDNHIGILRKLERFHEENIQIHIIASYGDASYIKEIESYVSQSVLRDKVLFEKEFIPYSQYVDLLNQMDIAILDAEYSYALGNIAILLLLQKTVCLNENGILKKSFDYLGIPCRTTDQIDRLSFAEFTQPVCYDIEKCEPLLCNKTYEAYIQDWKNLFDLLDGRKK